MMKGREMKIIREGMEGKKGKKFMMKSLSHRERDRRDKRKKIQVKIMCNIIVIVCCLYVDV